jgi:hypothetical protein
VAAVVGAVLMPPSYSAAPTVRSRMNASRSVTLYLTLLPIFVYGNLYRLTQRQTLNVPGVISRISAARFSSTSMEGEVAVAIKNLRSALVAFNNREYTEAKNTRSTESVAREW